MENAYLYLTLQQYKIGNEQRMKAWIALSPLIKQWASNFLLTITFSGSTEKETAVKGSNDVDMFISLSPNLNMSMKDIYDSLYDFIAREGFIPKKQNVSIGIDLQGTSIDLVPARKHPGNTNDHSLYSKRTGNWIQTDVQAQINHIKNSNRRAEIKLIKIWRNLNGIDFPSYCLELAVLDALHRLARNNLANNFRAVLEYLQQDFSSATLLDIAKLSNTVSDEMTTSEKTAVANAAGRTLQQNFIQQMIW